MKLKKMLAAVTAVSLAVSTMSAVGFTASADDEIAETVVYAQSNADDLPYDSEELEALYLYQLFYGDSGISLFKDYGASHLSGTALAVYNSLKGDINGVAGGSKTETIFTVSVAGATSDDVYAAIDCLMVDLPQSFYWYDKTKGNVVSTSSGSSDITVIFAVSNNYFPASGKTETVTFTDEDGNTTGTETYQVEVDPTEITRATNAINSIETFITATTGTAAQKVVAYKNKICELTDYNTGAAETPSTPYGDPWQLVHVFDGDPSTKVVCEGYSKAFQYLCDRGGVECYTVTGTMDGGTGAGPHMWNIVVIDGKSYLVDVTNCDDGSVGATDKLCLKEAAVSSPTGCTMDCGNGDEVVYVYDAYTIALYSRTLLTVEAESVETDLETDTWTTIADAECDSWDAYINTTETTEYTDLSLSLDLDSGKSITDVAKITVRYDVIDIYGNVIEGNSEASGTYGIIRDGEWVEDLSWDWDNSNNTTEVELGNDIQEGDEFYFAIYTLPQNTGVAVYFEVEYMTGDISAENPYITVTPISANLTVGETCTFTATITGGDISKVTWASNNTSVATVNPTTGVVTAVGEGASEIRALYDGVFLTNQSTNYGMVYVTGSGDGGAGGSGGGSGSGSGGSTTSTPTTSNNPAPVSQTTVADTILAVPESGSASVNLGSSTKVNKAVMETLAAKGDVTVKLSVAGGAYWEINGTNVTNAKDVNLGVKVNSKAIPASKVEAFAGDKITVQFSLSHNGDLGFTGTLNIPVGNSNNGKFANLYYYHGGKFDFVGSSAISGGRTQFVFTHASNYLIVIDDYAYGEDVSSAAAMSETAEASAVPYAAALVTLAAFGASAIVLKKRLSK